MSNKKLLLESFFCTLLIFALSWVMFVAFSYSIKPLNYLSQSLKTVYLTDIYYSQIKEEKVDTNIVLINSGELSRTEIAILIDSIAKKNPAVIGVDVLFGSNIPDSVGMQHIRAVANKHKDILVLSTYYEVSNSKLSQKFIHIQDIHYGHVNLITNSTRTDPIRHFHAAYISGKDSIKSFASAICSIISPESYQIIAARKNDKEFINYFGNQNSFKKIEGNEIINPSNNHAIDTDFLHNKIILIGFLGAGQSSTLDDLSDMFYSPLNDYFIGRSHPDIYGVVIHANILKMMLDKNYLAKPHVVFTGIMTFFVVYLHVIPFIYFFVKKHIWYHLAAKLIQLVTLVLMVMGIFYLIKTANILLDLRYMFLGIFLSVDLLYVYEAIAVILYKKLGWKSIFIVKH